MKYEIQKWITSRFACIFLVIVALNAFFFLQNTRHTNRELLANYDVYEDLVDGTASAEEIESSIALQIYLRQIESIERYPNYILTMPDRAASALNLTNDGADHYTLRNVAKTVEAFNKLETTNLRIGRDLAVTSPYKFALTDFFLLALSFYLITQVFTYEYEEEVYSLILSNVSRKNVAMQKLGFLALALLIVSTVLYGSNIIGAGYLFGFDDFTRNVQSIDAFRSLPHVMTVLHYFLFALANKWLNALAIAFVILLLFTILKKALYVLPIVAFASAGFYLLYSTIPVNSVRNALYYINPIHGLDSYNLIRRYQNINFFSYPVNVFFAWQSICLLVILLTSILIIRRFALAKVLHRAFQWNFAKNQLDKLLKKWSHMRRGTSLFVTELQKALFSGKAFALFLLLGVFLYSQVQNSYRYLDIESIMYDQYILQFQEDFAEDIFDKIVEERRLISISGEIEMVQRAKMDALERVELQSRRILEMQENRGIEAKLINDRHYGEWMSSKARDIRDVLIAFVASILLGAGIFARENAVGAIKLLRITPMHNELRRSKIALSISFSLIASTMVFLARYFEIKKHIPFENMHHAIQNHATWEQFPFAWSLSSYILVLFFIRMLISIALGTFIAGISSRAKNESFAIVILTAICVFPALAMYAGIREIQYFALAWVGEANILLNSPMKFWLWAFVLLFFMSLASLYIVKKEWSPQERNNTTLVK